MTDTSTPVVPDSAESAESTNGSKATRTKFALITRADVERLLAGRRSLGATLLAFDDYLAILSDGDTAEESNAKSEADALSKWADADPEEFARLSADVARIEAEMEALKAQRSQTRADILNAIEGFRDTAGIDTGTLATDYDVATKQIGDTLKTATGKSLAELGMRFDSLPKAFGRDGGVGMPRIGKAEYRVSGTEEWIPVPFTGDGATVADINAVVGSKLATAKFWRDQFSVGEAIPSTGLTATNVNVNDSHYDVRVFPRPSKPRS